MGTEQTNRSRYTRKRKKQSGKREMKALTQGEKSKMALLGPGRNINNWIKNRKKYLIIATPSEEAFGF